MSREPSAFSLLDALSESGFQASVIATYCCYFPFYEDVVLRRLLDRGCANNILIVDAERCADAFANEDTRPRRAGRDYTLVPVHMRGAFHPKLILTLGKSKGALFVGSHNMTIAGFGLNDEITNEFRTDGAGGRQGATVIREALSYLQGFALTGISDIDRMLAAARRNIPWLDGPASLDAGERHLITTTGEDADLWGRIAPLVPRRTSVAFVCGPFFDKQLAFLRRLRDEVKPKKLIVGIDPASVEIDPSAVMAFRGAQFVNVSGLSRVPNRRESGTTYLHAKILWFSGPDGELLVTGSANPSRAAFLSDSRRRNAEAVVADERSGAAKALGLDELISAPQVESEDWERVAARQADRSCEETTAQSALVLAAPGDDGLILERTIGPGIKLDAFATDGRLLGPALTRTDDQRVVDTTTEVRDGAQTLRGFDQGSKPVLVLIHRSDEVARNIGGDRQRDLRQALGALDEDPSQLETLLKLTEKVIFDSDDVSIADPVVSRKDQSGRDAAPKSGPKSLRVDAVGRHVGRQKRRLASGDVLVLLDALIGQLGEGLSGPASAPPLGEEVRPVAEGDTGDEDVPLPPPYPLLAKACRSKVGRLVRRLARQLEIIPDAAACRAVVQLAAVLSVVHALRFMEQRAEWRSKHLKLVDPDIEWRLFEVGSFALAWGSSSLGQRALEETGEDSFEELSLAIGLLAWLAWETGIDVDAALERTNLTDRDDSGQWHAIQVFATIAVPLAADSEAREKFADAIRRTPQPGTDSADWLAGHLRLADHVAWISKQPQDLRKLSRPPRAGDLAILGSTLDPRVRVVLEVEPSGTSDKITVFDQGSEGGRRKILASHVKHSSWLVEDGPMRRATPA